MAENENVLVQDEVQPETPSGPSKMQKFKAGAKEWFRKRIVSLKRGPQIIPLLLLLISTIFFMLELIVFSEALFNCSTEMEYVPAAGICLFISTLLSLLVLVSFLNSFPKRKKPNIMFIVLVFVMIAGMIACDMVYYAQINSYLMSGKLRDGSTVYGTIESALAPMLAHVILLGISAVVFALLPLYKRLILKIDTSVALESATEKMKGGIDLED